ncbi:MAG: efflux RND transporter permease subunit, partial [Elusimicrobia bacterium]|nr:efflux RND transporter permease subunit [Elusimicrobiota bacterium]
KKTWATKAETIIKATAELWKPVFASTVTTIVVFLPLVFLEPEIRQLYVPFGLTITFALIASLIATMVFLPPQIYFWQNKFDLEYQGWFMSIRRTYGRMLKFVFKRQFFVWSAVFLVFLLSVHILSQRDSEFLDAGDVNTFRIGVQFPPATRIEVSNELVKQIEAALLSYRDQVTRVSSKVEKLHTFIEVTVNANAQTFREHFRTRFGEFSPAFVYFQEGGASAAREMFIDLYGQDYDVLKQIAFSASGKLQQIQGLDDIKIRMREDEPEINLVVDPHRLAMFGMTTYFFANYLHCQLRGLIATRYRTDGRFIDTIARLVPDTIRSAEELPFLSVVSPSREIVFVGQVAEVEKVQSTQEIWRKNKRRFIQISANRNNIGLTAAAEQIRQVMATVNFPQDYSFNIAGDYERTVRNRSQFMFAIALTIILIYFVLASIFESYIQPAIIMFSLPLSVIGVAIALWAFDKPISLGVWIGMMILFGSIVYGAIIVIDKINIRRVGRTNLLRVIFEACKERLRPEIIASLMKTLGLVPMVISTDQAASMWRSLGMTVLFGTISGTVLTMLIVPSAYYFLEEPKKVMRGIFGNFKFLKLGSLQKKLYNFTDKFKKSREAEALSK